MNLPINPYIAGNPVRDDKGFFGRREVADWVTREFLNPSTNAIVVFGQRRIGKTSLLLHLRRSLPPDHFLPIYFDLQDQARLPLGEVLGELADGVARRLKMPEPDLDKFDHRGKHFQRVFLPELYAAIDRHVGPGVRPILLFDEFEVLDTSEEGELLEGAAARTLHPFLRRLMREDPRLGFLFATGRSTEDLSGEVKTSFKASLHKTIWVLDRESAVRLILQAESNGTLTFQSDAVHRILELTNCHPYLTQLLCQRIWESAERRRRKEPPPPGAKQRSAAWQPRPIGVQQAEAAVQEALDVGDNALVWIWDGLSPAEKVFAAAAGEIAQPGGSRGVSVDQVLEVIGRHAPHRRSQEVEQAAQGLVKWRVLKATTDRSLSFEIEMFRQWVRARRPLHVVDEELDRLKPEAEAKFATGESLVRKKKLSLAGKAFQEAIDINPRHLRAHLALGEIYLKAGLAKNAVAMLEDAHRLDPTQARLALVRALVTYAEEARHEDENLALQLCDQALGHSPTEPEAKRIRGEIWGRRGDQAMQERHLDRALECFRQAEDAPRIALIEEKRRQRKQEIQTVLERIKPAVQGSLAAATACEATVVDVEQPMVQGLWWAAARMFREEARSLLPLYKAIEALREEKWGLAQRQLREVLDVRPIDEREDETLIGPTGMPGDGTQSPQIPGFHEEHASVLKPALQVAKCLNQAIADSELPTTTAQAGMSREAWGHAVQVMNAKGREAQRLIDGVRALQQKKWSRAEKAVGWCFPRSG